MPDYHVSPKDQFLRDFGDLYREARKTRLIDVEFLTKFQSLLITARKLKDEKKVETPVFEDCEFMSVQLPENPSLFHTPKPDDSECSLLEYTLSPSSNHSDKHSTKFLISPDIDEKVSGNMWGDDGISIPIVLFKDCDETETQPPDLKEKSPPLSTPRSGRMKDCHSIQSQNLVSPDTLLGSYLTNDVKASHLANRPLSEFQVELREKLAKCRGTGASPRTEKEHCEKSPEFPAWRKTPKGFSYSLNPTPDITRAESLEKAEPTEIERAVSRLRHVSKIIPAKETKPCEPEPPIATAASQSSKPGLTVDPIVDDEVLTLEPRSIFSTFTAAELNNYLKALDDQPFTLDDLRIKLDLTPRRARRVIYALRNLYRISADPAHDDMYRLSTCPN